MKKDFYIFFFLISNSFIDNKKESPKYTGSIQGQNNQLQKLDKSSRSTTENKEWLLKADNQSSKVLKNNNLRSGMVPTVS